MTAAAGDDRIAAHYAPGALGEAVLAALAAAGKDVDHLRPADLAAIDEFHIRGREATVELAAELGLGVGQEVLDVGAGLGGASRYLAATFGCRVTGLDLTEEYCRVATMLAERVGNAARVSYRHGSALAMPFADGAFDVVWTQHATMNIADKPRLYGEIRRVLRPGGLFAMYDVLAGPAGPPRFPVPWARDPSMSFLVTPPALRGLLEAAGFEVVRWRDTSALGRAWFAAVAARVGGAAGPPPLGVHVLLGRDFPLMAANMAANLREDRIVLLEAVTRRGA